MDDELVEDVIVALMERGDFSEEDIHEIECRLLAEHPDRASEFEKLRLHFTDIFLQHPDMLGKNTFQSIVDKAAQFTQTYMEYEQL